MNFLVDGVLPVAPHLFPGQNLRIFQQQSPEGNEVAVRRTLGDQGIAHILCELFISGFGALDIDPALAALFIAKLAEAANSGWIGAAAMIITQRIVERPLTL